MQDDIDINALEIHNSPDVSRWLPTIAITTIRETPERGYELVFDRPVPDSWKWASNPKNPSDNFQYTVWFCALINGIWHGAGFVQMWQGRDFNRSLPPLFQDVDGAPGYTRLWGDSRRLWGELSNYVPSPGDRLGIMVTAGNARLFDRPSSVAERSNLVLFPVTISDLFTATYGDFVPPVPAPLPPTVPNEASLEQKIDVLIGQVAHLSAAVAALQASHLVGDVNFRYVGIGKADLVFK